MTEVRITFVDNGVLAAKDLNTLQDNIYSHVAERADKLTQDLAGLGARLTSHAHTGGDQGPQLDGTAIKANAIATAHLVNGAVTADKLGANAVVTAKIADQAVANAKLADQSVTSTKLAPKAVTADKLADGLGVPSLIARVWFDPGAGASHWNWTPAGRIRSVSSTRDGMATILTITLMQNYKANDYNVMLSAAAWGASVPASVRGRTQNSLIIRLQTLDLTSVDVQFVIFGDLA